MVFLVAPSERSGDARMGSGFMLSGQTKDNKCTGRRAEFVRDFWRFCLILVWGTWWGGLCFYAIVVVPIGTEVIGSVEQGFITQQVAQWHNRISIVFLLCMMVEAYRQRCRILWSLAAILAIVELALMAWHMHLTKMMDFTHHAVPNHFYAEHAVYLWITAVEWFLGMLIPPWLFRNRDEQARNCQTF